MPVYLIADITITDDSWVPAYAAEVHDIVKKHGGEYLSRSANIDMIEGDNPGSTVFAILKFPDRAALNGFVNDPAYAPHAKARQAGSVSIFRTIDDTDAVGTIPYLPAGG